MLARYSNPKRPQKSSALKRQQARIDAAWISDALNRADAILAAPPARPHIVRVKPAGALVARFVLPLNLCPTLNAFAEMQGFARKKIKEAATLMMLTELRFNRPRQPLLGRPFVRAVRFSSAEVDRDSGWCKVPIDRLTGKNGGLGFIQDDKPSKLDLAAWWEYAPPSRGFALVEVFTGKAET